MSDDLTIEPVPQRRRAEAIRFLAGGRRRDLASQTRADVLRRFAREGGPSCRLWRARRGRRCVAVAMVSESPGRTGMLYHAPAEAPGVDAEALAATVRAISADAVAGGMYFVQSLLSPGADADAAAILASGYVLLAELLYLRLDLGAREADEASEDRRLSWRAYGEYDERELAELISLTYVRTQDVALLSGLRDPMDVIAGHKSGGEFSPEGWLIADCDGQAAGCVLVNDFPGSESADVVYLGVTPAMRRKGVGRRLIDRAIRDVRIRGLRALALAVDAGNVAARKLYDSAGFRRVGRRFAYVFLAKERADEGVG